MKLSGMQCPNAIEEVGASAASFRPVLRPACPTKEEILVDLRALRESQEQSAISTHVLDRAIAYLESH